MQYFDTGWFKLLFTFAMVVFILFNIARAKRADVFLRRIPGLNAIDEAIGRATEMGRPVLMVPGIGDVAEVGIMAQALVIFSHIAKTIAKFGTPMRLCVAYAPAYTLAQEIIRDAYQEEGQIEKYDPDSVQFVTDRQFAFAAGVSGMIHRDQTATCFFLGAFYAESLIFAETANSVGALQVAGSTQNTQTPFFIAACDYVLIADEFYAASAYLGREPVLVGSLTGQDWSKMTIAGVVLAFTVLMSVQLNQTINEDRTPDGRWVPAAKAHKRLKSETLPYALFNPVPPVKGTPVTATFAGLPDYIQRRRSELGSEADGTETEKATVEGEDGAWYRWEITQDGLKRFVDDFLVVGDTEVRLLRSHRSRPQKPPEDTEAGGGEG